MCLKVAVDFIFEMILCFKSVSAPIVESSCNVKLLVIVHFYTALLFLLLLSE